MDILRMGTAAIAAGAMALIGISHYSGADTTPAPVFITMPAAAPSASICEVTCPGYVAPDEDYHPAPSFLYEKPTIPTTGIVTVYVAAPVTPAQTAAAQPKAAKAPKAAATPKQAKASSSGGSKASGTTSAPKTTTAKAPKQAQPSTTVTTKQSTTTTAKGTTTTSTSTTTTHRG